MNMLLFLLIGARKVRRFHWINNGLSSDQFGTRHYISNSSYCRNFEDILVIFRVLCVCVWWITLEGLAATKCLFSTVPLR
jgi:hypothetical protein